MSFIEIQRQETNFSPHYRKGLFSINKKEIIPIIEKFINMIPLEGEKR